MYNTVEVLVPGKHQVLMEQRDVDGVVCNNLNYLTIQLKTLVRISLSLRLCKQLINYRI